ncbi:MAG TPA: hypothetical protein VGD98_23350 [Ktedonobacteraceae bacterium]
MHREITTSSTATFLPPEYLFTHVETEATVSGTVQELHSAGHTEIALVAICLRYPTTERNRPLKTLADDLAKQGMLYLLQHLRTLVRKTDKVFMCGHYMYFVLLAAKLQGAEIVEERLWEALLWHIHSMGEQDLPRPEHVSIGHSAFPLPQASSEELLSASQAISKHFGPRVRRVTQRAGRTQEEASELLEAEEELPRLAKRLGIPYLTFLPSRPPRRALQVVSTSLARELRCYPLGRERNMLTVAMLNPQDQQALERLHQETGLQIFPVLTHPQALENALQQLGS